VTVLANDGTSSQRFTISVNNKLVLLQYSENRYIYTESSQNFSNSSWAPGTSTVTLSLNFGNNSRHFSIATDNSRLLWLLNLEMSRDGKLFRLKINRKVSRARARERERKYENYTLINNKRIIIVYLTYILS